MSWVFFSIAGYFLNALAALTDKFLIGSGRIAKPAAYAWYVSLFSLFVIAFLPFQKFFGGFQYYGLLQLFLSLLSGILFVYGLVGFYESMKASEVSRVAPFVLGVISPLMIFFLTSFFGEGAMSRGEILGLGILVLSGIVLIPNFSAKSSLFFEGLGPALLGGILMGMSVFLLKVTFEAENFFSAFIWNRLGMFLGGASLWLFPLLRTDILNGDRKKIKSVVRSRNILTAIIFVSNKALAGIAGILVAYAVSLGSASIVQALSSTQFIFLLVISFLASLISPKIFQEHFGFRAWMQKTGAVILVAVAIFLMYNKQI